MFPVSLVSYTNSLPYRAGLELLAEQGAIALSLDVPSACARKLIEGEALAGLIPVAVLPQLKNYRIGGNMGIAAMGNVGSVFLMSDKPLHEIERIELDWQSRTSVLLTRVLCRFFWHIDPEFLPTGEGYEVTGGTNRSFVIIGDRAIRLRGKYRYCYDLSGEWTRFTGLPFVFAVWALRQEVSREQEHMLCKALRAGLAMRTALLGKAREVLQETGLDSEGLRKYWFSEIRYHLGAPEMAGLDLFLNLSRKISC